MREEKKKNLKNPISRIVPRKLSNAEEEKSLNAAETPGKERNSEAEIVTRNEKRTEEAELKSSAFSDKLLTWYKENHRVLPWRDDPSPYHVWLSEIMLQQTRVEAVKAYYARFLSVLPNIEALALAEEDVYLKLWEGLGYYSRVRNLHKAAVELCENYGGQLPDSAAELSRISGIGPYTSAAIASIAFGERIPAIDGNLLRLYARLNVYEGSIKDNAGKKAAFDFFLKKMPEESRGRLLDRENPLWNPCGAFNQALMDLGATVCTPNGQPKCLLCPFREECEAHKRGQELAFPRKEEKKARGIEKKTVFLIRRGGIIALRKRPKRGLLAGLYEFPNAPGHLTEEEALHYAESLGFLGLRIRRLRDARHIFTHKEWDMIAYEILADELSPFYQAEKREMLSEPGVEYAVDAEPELGDSYASGRVRKEDTEIQREKDELRGAGEVFLAELQDIREKYSIPSAFAAYAEVLK